MLRSISLKSTLLSIALLGIGVEAIAQLTDIETLGARWVSSFASLHKLRS
ncbi:MAG: hypothetical protein ACUVRP_06430 [Chlorobiales bacterium]